jgi:hypothetical protein
MDIPRISNKPLEERGPTTKKVKNLKFEILHQIRRCLRNRFLVRIIGVSALMKVAN